MSDVATTARNLLAIPDAFRQTALSFPGQIDQALALVDDMDGATELLARVDMLASYAARVKADTEIMNAISYGKIKIVAKIAELSPPATKQEAGAQGGRGNKKAETCHSPALPESTVKRYRKVYQNLPKLDEYRQECSEAAKELTTDGFIRFATGTEKAGLAAHVSANTGVPEWYTPPVFIEAARQVLGTIDLDPASSDKAQETVKAKQFFTIDVDGLTKPWIGKVWLNPPYASDLVVKFVEKLINHVQVGEVTSALLLVNNATETKWFQQAGRLAAAVCFPEKRIHFLDENGDEGGSPLQGQAVLYFGDNIGGFLNGFQSFGLIFTNGMRCPGGCYED